MEDVNKRRRISFLSLNLSAVLKKSTPGKFAYTCHFQQIGINATKIEKTGNHFKTGVFAAVAVVDAKAPYYMAESASGQDGRDFPRWSREENFSIWPYNESLIDRACLIKKVVYWPRSFFPFLLTTTSSRPKKKRQKRI